ncbi:MAG: antitoxin Xre/MbcA/ParS toxin-binding domain-containing protein [Pseudomonadota bacterium]
MNIEAVAEQFRVSVSRVDGLYELGFSKPEVHVLVAPPRTLARRKNRLSLEESDRVQRLERILEHATRVFGTLEKANGWLRSKNRALGGSIPLELLASETGANGVEEVLGRIEYGIFS